MIRRARDDRDLEAALAVRFRVFVEEQGVTPEGEVDGRDPEAMHLLAEEDGEVVGTCRILFDGSLAKFGRLAVLPHARGRGIGAALLSEAESEARRAGATRMGLHAQTGARSLYERAGYEPHGDLFMDEGIEHIAMYRSL